MSARCPRHRRRPAAPERGKAVTGTQDEQGKGHRAAAACAAILCAFSRPSRSSALTLLTAEGYRPSHRQTMGKKNTGPPGTAARHARHADPQDALVGVMHGYGIAQHIRTRVGRGAEGRGGIALPGPAAPADPGADRLGMGAVGEQPPRPLLPPHARGAPRRWATRNRASPASSRRSARVMRPA